MYIVNEIYGSDFSLSNKFLLLLSIQARGFRLFCGTHTMRTVSSNDKTSFVFGYEFRNSRRVMFRLLFL